jgi:hypothetical protein
MTEDQLDGMIGEIMIESGFEAMVGQCQESDAPPTLADEIVRENLGRHVC